jgi:hypothetical protein
VSEVIFGMAGVPLYPFPLMSLSFVVGCCSGKVSVLLQACIVCLCLPQPCEREIKISCAYIVPGRLFVLGQAAYCVCPCVGDFVQ